MVEHDAAHQLLASAGLEDWRDRLAGGLVAAVRLLARVRVQYRDLLMAAVGLRHVVLEPRVPGEHVALVDDLAALGEPYGLEPRRGLHLVLRELDLLDLAELVGL